MNLKDFFHTNYKKGLYQTTDRDTSHNYITQYYSDKLSKHRFDSISIVEIGIFKLDGLKLLRDYFQNATIIGVDTFPQIFDEESNSYVYITNTDKYMQHFPNNYSDTFLNGCEIHIMNAYSDEILNRIPNDSLDFIIEDGSHRIDDQVFTVKNWFKKLKNGGTMVIEDIQSVNDWELLIEAAKSIGASGRIIDLRSETISYDNVLFEVIK